MSTLSAVPVEVPGSKDFGRNIVAFVVKEALSKEECDELIALTERKGYITAAVNVGGGKEIIMTDYRNSLRCIVDDESQANKIFNRIREFLPETFHGRTLIGLNERLRFLKYEPGHFFAPHRDGCYVRPENDETSMLTLLLYLNSDSTGGATRFFSLIPGVDKMVDVIPETGLALVFQHDLYHEGLELQDGVKYVMRTDVMYSAI